MVGTVGFCCGCCPRSPALYAFGSMEGRLAPATQRAFSATVSAQFKPLSGLCLATKCAGAAPKWRSLSEERREAPWRALSFKWGAGRSCNADGGSSSAQGGRPNSTAEQGRHGGVRARIKAPCQVASFSSSSPRSIGSVLCPALSRRWSLGSETNSHQKNLNWNAQFSSLGTPQLRAPVSRQSPTKTRAVPSASLVGPRTVAVAASLFQLATVFVIPFYSAMILAPQRDWTKKMMESELTYFILGMGYIYLLCLSWTPETAGLMFSSKYWLPELSGITRMFSSTTTVASAWLHLLAVDLFAGRQIFLDGLNHNVETRHSLVLCLMMCPIGIFCHLITKSFALFSRRTGKLDDVERAVDSPLEIA